METRIEVSMMDELQEILILLICRMKYFNSFYLFSSFIFFFKLRIYLSNQKIVGWVSYRNFIHFHYYFLPTIFTFTIIFCRHVSNVTSSDKISPIIFTFTIIFCWHVSNFTSRDKISPIIFTFTITFTIIFCRHVRWQDLPHNIHFHYLFLPTC